MSRSPSRRNPKHEVDNEIVLVGVSLMDDDGRSHCLTVIRSAMSSDEVSMHTQQIRWQSLRSASSLWGSRRSLVSETRCGSSPANSVDGKTIVGKPVS